jgi:alkylhydroperoxidase family enzyme
MDGVSVPGARHDALIARLRAAARPERAVPDSFGPYLTKVRERAYTVTDEDVQALKARGHSEEEIFELTVSAAVAAGLERLEAGLRVLR